jgi:putative NADH-flavin reductase
MKLLIIGATGPTGRELVKQAMSQGHEVTALVRDAAKAAFAPPARTVIGNILDVASPKAAVTGQDAVISALGSTPSGPFKEPTLLAEGTSNLVTIMRTVGVNRLISITGIGAGDSKGHGPWFYNLLIQPLVLRGTYHDKSRQEKIVRDSGLDWTLVRPAILTNGPGKGPEGVQAFTALTGIRVGTIRRADVAAFCLRELADRRLLRQAPVITN